MILSLVEILTEYLSIAFCMQKAAGEKIKIDKYATIFAILNFIILFLIQKYRQDHSWIIIIVYLNYFAYAKIRLASKWIQAVKAFGIMLITIPSLQLIVYYLTKICFVARIWHIG